jgi:putative ABC transport system permease protein
MWRDFRLAARSLSRSPTFTLAATLALGLAIGANATIFSIADGLWFRPPGVRAPGELVRIFSVTGETRDGLWSFPEYLTLRDSTSTLEGVVAIGRRGAIVPAADGPAELVLANVVSLNFFTTLGVVPAAGRLFSPDDEDALAASAGLVLGQAYWTRRFGADPDVVGTTIRLGDASPVPVVILGVLPPGFRELDAAADRDLWLPPATWVRLSARAEFERRGDRWFEIVARRRSGASVAAATAEVSALTENMATAHPDTNRGRHARVISDFDYRREAGGANAAALIGLVLLVVALTCVNVANLLLARAAGRRRELALRKAIGANRRQLARQLMAESLLIGAAGAAAGVLIGMWLVRLLPFLIVDPPGLRSLTVFQVDGRIVAVTLAVALATTLLFGLTPSWVAARSDVSDLLKHTAAGRTRGSQVGGAFVIAQVAISLVLLSAAAVLARSFLATGRADLGFARKPVLTAWSTADVPAAVLRDAVRRLTALPGVARVAVALRAPLSLSGGGRAQDVTVAGARAPAGESASVKYGAVSANYFETMGIGLVKGRTFSDEEEAGGEPVVIVNSVFVNRFLSDRDPIGALVRIGGAKGAEHRVIAVAPVTVVNRIGEPPEPYFYLPYWRERHGEVTFLIETGGNPAALAPPVRAALIGLEPSLDPRRLLALEQYLDYSAGSYRAMAALASALALVGLILTAVGVYGVMAYRTARRVREFAIRIALGAVRGQVFRMVMREGARVGLVGAAIGVPAALVTTWLLQSMLFGVGPWDGRAFAGAALALFAAIAVATFVPAWRATRDTPATALRE